MRRDHDLAYCSKGSLAVTKGTITSSRDIFHGISNIGYLQDCARSMNRLALVVPKPNLEILQVLWPLFRQNLRAAHQSENSNSLANLFCSNGPITGVASIALAGRLSDRSSRWCIQGLNRRCESRGFRHPISLPGSAPRSTTGWIPLQQLEKTGGKHGGCMVLWDPNSCTQIKLGPRAIMQLPTIVDRLWDTEHMNMLIG